MEYLSVIDHVSDGVQKIFAVPFPYIKKEYVSAFQIDPGDLDNPQSVPFTWQDPHNIVLDAAAPNGWTVRIQRNTEEGEPLVPFTDGGPITKRELALSQNQLLHLIQERNETADLELAKLIKELESATRSEDIARLQAAIASLEQAKASKAEVDAKLVGKADKSHIHADLATKAELGGKADTSALNSLATKTELTNGLAGKASTASVTDAAPGLMTPAMKIKLDALVPGGGNVGDLIGNTGSGVGAWQSPATVADRFPKASAAVYGLAKADGVTITASGGVLTAIGGGGEGTSDHRALSNREAADQHPTSAITGLDATLSGLRTDVDAKAAAADLTAHTGNTSNPHAVTPAQIGAAPVNHTQAIPTVTGLQSALDAKAEASALANYATNAALTAGLADKADLSHNHTIPQVSGLQAAIDAKANTSSLGALAFAGDAPADGNDYVRSNGAWKAFAGGGGAIIGEIRLLPFRSAELPAGWRYPSGDYVAQSSDIGQVLLAFSSTYKSDWGITISGSNIRLFNPTKFFSGTMGRFFRAVNNSARYPGSTEEDAIRNLTGEYYNIYNSVAYGSVWPSGGGYEHVLSGIFKVGRTVPYSFSSTAVAGSASLTIDASQLVPTATENRPYNVGFTPAVYLGV